MIAYNFGCWLLLIWTSYLRNIRISRRKTIGIISSRRWKILKISSFSGMGIIGIIGFCFSYHFVKVREFFMWGVGKVPSRRTFMLITQIYKLSTVTTVSKLLRRCKKGRKILNCKEWHIKWLICWSLWAKSIKDVSIWCWIRGHWMPCFQRTANKMWRG